MATTPAVPRISTLQRFWKPRMYTEYYQTPLLLSLLFWCVTVLTGTTIARLVLAYRGHWTLMTILLVVLVAALWVHVILQHHRISRMIRARPQDSSEGILYTMAWSTSAFWIAFFIAVNALIPRAH